MLQVRCQAVTSAPRDTPIIGRIGRAPCGDDEGHRFIDRQGQRTTDDGIDPGEHTLPRRIRPPQRITIPVLVRMQRVRLAGEARKGIFG